MLVHVQGFKVKTFKQSHRSGWIQWSCTDHNAGEMCLMLTSEIKIYKFIKQATCHSYNRFVNAIFFSLMVFCWLKLDWICTVLTYYFDWVWYFDCVVLEITVSQNTDGLWLGWLANYYRLLDKGRRGLFKYLNEASLMDLIIAYQGSQLVNLDTCTKTSSRIVYISWKKYIL